MLGRSLEVNREGWSVGTELGSKVYRVLPCGTCQVTAMASIKVSPKIARRADVAISLQRNDRL
jgi:hypothetical protein